MKGSKIRDIEMVKWKCRVGYTDATESPFEGFAPLEELAEEATKDVAMGAPAIISKAKSCKTGEYVTVLCNVRTGQGSKWGAKATVLCGDVVEAVKRCFEQCVKRANYAKKKRVLDPPPGMSEKAKEMLAAMGEVANNMRAAKKVVDIVQTIAPAAAPAAPAAAAAGAAAAGATAAPATQGGMGAIITMAMGALKDPETMAMVSEIMENPQEIMDMFKGMTE